MMVDEHHDIHGCGGSRTLALALFVLLLASAAGAVPAAAQEPPPDSTGQDTTVYAVQGLVVRAARPVATVGGASAVDVELDSLGLAPAPTLDEVLRSVPLVQIRQNSRGETHFALRGAQERQIAVLVDGVPLTLGWDHRSDLSIVPMLAASHVRMDRGLPSVLHGPNVLGGVVEVSVARGPFALQDPPPLVLDMGLDHVGTRALGAAGGRRLDVDDGELTVRAGAGFRDRPGFALASGLESAGTDGLRTNSDARQLNGFAALRYRSDAGRWLSFSASGFNAERGVAPEEHEDSPRLWRYPSLGRMFAAVSGGTGQLQTPWGEGDLEASVGVDLGRTEIEEFASRAYEEVVGGETGRTRTMSLRLLGEHSVGRSAELRTAFTMADVYHDEVLRPTLDERYTNEYRQRLWSVGTETIWRLGSLAGGVLTGAQLSGGVVLDGAFTPLTGGHPERPPMTEWGGRLGFSALAGEGMRLHAGVSRRARFPSLRELYSAALGKFEPNPELGAEKLLAAEAGVTTRLGAAAEVQLVGFHHRLTDAMARTASDVAKYKRINRDEIRSTGVELLAGFSHRGVSLSGELTLQRVRVIDPDSEAAQRAEYHPAVAGGVDASMPLPGEFRATAGVEYMGRQWCVVPGADDDGMSLEPSTWADVGLRRSFELRDRGVLRTVDASLSVDNVTDAAVYDQCGLPQPGRTLRLQFRLR